LNCTGRKHPKPELIEFANAVRKGLVLGSCQYLRVGKYYGCGDSRLVW
jgi:hypothetical protein